MKSINKKEQKVTRQDKVEYLTSKLDKQIIKKIKLERGEISLNPYKLGLFVARKERVKKHIAILESILEDVKKTGASSLLPG